MANKHCSAKKLMRAIICLIALTLAAQFAGAAIDLESGHDVAFYTKLRLDYAARKGFSPDWTIEEARKAITTAYQNGDTEKTISLGQKWLEKVPVDAEIYLMIAMCMKEKGDLRGYCQYIAPFYGLLQSITASGDGKSQETAFKVISVSEEYYLLHEIGAKVKQQSLVGHCDKMEVERRGGKEYTFYFDVSISLEATARALNVK
jgi:hypothetical protein